MHTCTLCLYAHNFISYPLSSHTALSQAGRHLEDSIIASYCAVLIGIIVQHSNSSAANSSGDVVDHSISSVDSIGGDLVEHSTSSVDGVVQHSNCVESVMSMMPSKSFSEMIGMLGKFISFMSMTVS